MIGDSVKRLRRMCIVRSPESAAVRRSFCDFFFFTRAVSVL